MSDIYPATHRCRLKYSRKHNSPCWHVAPVLVQDEYTNLPTDEESDRIAREVSRD